MHVPQGALAAHADMPVLCSFLQGSNSEKKTFDVRQGSTNKEAVLLPPPGCLHQGASPAACSASSVPTIAAPLVCCAMPAGHHPHPGVSFPLCKLCSREGQILGIACPPVHLCILPPTTVPSSPTVVWAS